MKLSAFALSSVLALAAASPLGETSAPVLERSLMPRAAAPTPCQVGSQYCGWAMTEGGLNWDPEVLRFALCDATGDCDWQSNKAWNYIWYCQRKYFAVPQKLCGLANNSCKGPVATCA